ncbi:sulfotransferase domain-containing protein [Rubellimicrobium sp. CFH 75288]|uniref:sulfotransferase domain-containing protein n=1 Tax=Rubellimicrobium sp. CFH 75288 TaxID=2697034 RepID=UPI001411DBEE|nr:sulfotransferase domain-containing protein [Rubellimicrobium sp. CFH 75288]NAZ38166.1 hypothetical protein [Rubellimicrobium sp. CFH 75288]
MQVTFEVGGRTLAVALPAPGRADRPSAFVLGLPKAGSTLLNRIMRPLLNRAGLAPFSFANALFDLGVPPDGAPAALAALYRPAGYAYVGFRGVLPALPLPPFADGRTVVLVRDPRDMLVSWYFSEAYSHTPPGRAAGDGLLQDFEAARARARATEIDEYAVAKARTLAQIHAALRDQLAGLGHRVWRYEDVVFDKLRWTREMLAYLDLDPPAALVERVVAQNDLRPEAENPDRHIRRVTPGDHRNKLSERTRERIEAILADMMREYGYA